MSATRRKLTNRSDRARGRYQSGYGHRPMSDWGSGDLMAPYAEGDIVEIPEGAPAFGGRIPHEWSAHPDECKPGFYRVVQVFSIGELDDWYLRVCPIVNGETMWDNRSDRLHIVPGTVDYTEGWVLVESADPDNADQSTRERIVAQYRCPRGHRDRVPDDKFCPECGTELLATPPDAKEHQT